ncbi:MAG TPA: hypothetical protein PK014_13745 [Thermoanaerobaculia bacterium]|nr:hypothetical protein [Thermoanaerobaculia bacterium]HUM31103.1 hypothetical protein [Thermoanaerobaculia bacterium]HXK69459.1 hypothetical protein [Thermoanaerobaculia bacterium]
MIEKRGIENNLLKTIHSGFTRQNENYLSLIFAWLLDKSSIRDLLWNQLTVLDVDLVKKYMLKKIVGDFQKIEWQAPNEKKDRWYDISISNTVIEAKVMAGTTNNQLTEYFKNNRSLILLIPKYRIKDFYLKLNKINAKSKIRNCYFMFWDDIEYIIRGNKKGDTLLELIDELLISSDCKLGIIYDSELNADIFNPVIFKKENSITRLFYQREINKLYKDLILHVNNKIRTYQKKEEFIQYKITSTDIGYRIYLPTKRWGKKEREKKDIWGQKKVNDWFIYFGVSCKKNKGQPDSIRVVIRYPKEGHKAWKALGNSPSFKTGLDKSIHFDKAEPYQNYDQMLEFMKKNLLLPSVW